MNEEVEERLLVAFVRQAEAMLTDMEHKWRWTFWGEWSPVVSALVAQASDEVKHRVGIKLAAKATFAEKYGAMPEELRELIRKMTPQFDETREEAIAECPACSSQCVAAGVVTTDADFDRDGLAYTWTWVEFTPLTLFHQQCGLRLTMQAELAAAGVPQKWNLPDLDAAAYLVRDWGEDYG